MWRAVMVAAIVGLVGFGFTLASSGGIYLAVIAVVLAYLRGRMDESEAKQRRRGGFIGGRNGGGTLA